MRWRWLLPVLSIASTTLAATPSATAGPSPKSVGLIDRVIAVVGYDCILLSELRARARFYLGQLDTSGPKSGPARAAAEAHIYRDVLDRMIEERLIAGEAERMMLVVTATEIDAAMQTVAAGQGLTVPKLVEAAKVAGFSEKEYRDELRRQLVDGKVVQLRVVPRIKGYSTMVDPARAQRLDEERRKYLQELREASFIEVRL